MGKIYAPGDLLQKKANKEIADEVAEQTARKEVDDLVGFRKEHILNRHRAGAGKLGKTEFPADLDDNRIFDEINKIANDANASGGVGKYNSPYKTGTVDGVEIRVDFYPSDHPTHSGKVSTAYPTNVPANPSE